MNILYNDLPQQTLRSECTKLKAWLRKPGF